MRAALSLFAFVLAAVSANAQETASGSDDRLLKTVTVKDALVPLPTALKDLSKAAGFTLESTVAISNLKVTVLVKEQPAGVVMNRLADVLHGEWKADGPLYRLSISSDWKNSEAAFVEAEDKVRRREAEAQIAPLMEGAAIPWNEIQEELKKSPNSIPDKRRPIMQRVASPQLYLTGRMFRQMSPAAWRAFWSGRPMSMMDIFESAPPDAPTNPKSGGAATKIGTAIATLRASAMFNPVNGHLTLNGPTNGFSGRMIEWPYPSGELASHPFAKEVNGWIAGDLSDKVFEKQVTVPPRSGSYWLNRSSMADVLLWLHEQSGVPIVADAFRTPVVVPESGGSVATVLNSLRQANSAFLRVQDGFVMLRHGGFWRLKLLETPEEVLRRMEGSNQPSLDDYATLASRLTDLQALPFRAGQILTKFDPEPIRSGLSALRFYNSLSGTYRQAARAGTAIPFAQLASGSRQLFLDAMDDPFAQASGRPMNLQDPEVARALGFVMRSTAVQRVTSTPEGPRGNTGAGTEMLFGTSQAQAVRYSIPVG